MRSLLMFHSSAYIEGFVLNIIHFWAMQEGACTFNFMALIFMIFRNASKYLFKNPSNMCKWNKKIIKYHHNFLKTYLFLFNDSAYRKYLTAIYSYDVENVGGMDYDQIPAANPGTTAMTPVTRRQTIPTNYPVATMEDNKAVSESYLEWVFILFHMGGHVVHFCSFFYADTLQILCGSIFGKHVFLTQIIWFFLVQILDNYNCNRFSKCYLVGIGNNAWIIHHTHSNGDRGQQVKKCLLKGNKNW